MKLAFVIGTRPELIKVAPLIWEAKKNGIEYDVINTAQHKDLLEPYWSTFNIEPTHILDVMVSNQNLSSLTARAINQIQNYINEVAVKPSVIIAQGDTTTVMAASLVSFYNQIKFAHVEAGLRSFDFQNPFPEEFNRKIASISATFHFCPTLKSQENLLNEGIEQSKIFVVGNTVIDSLMKISQNANFKELPWLNKKLNQIHQYQKSVLITCHRRENHGRNLEIIIEAIEDLAQNNQDFVFVWTLHPNPNVKQKVLDSNLRKFKNVLLIEPLEYIDILKFLDIANCAISDSGGIQEEAPSFKTPVIVLREATERPEGIDAGLAFLVGAVKQEIVNKFNELKTNYPRFDYNPYGDGKSSEKIINIITNLK
jgi:UDP-N-acetylglucosamine 2-epimerase